MIQKIIKKSSKIDQKSVEIEAWTDPGGCWERPWEPFGLPRPPGTEKRSQMTKKWPPLGLHFGVHFRFFPWFFASVLVLFFSLPFWSHFFKIFIEFGSHFGVIFWTFFNILATNRNFQKWWKTIGFSMFFEVFAYCKCMKMCKNLELFRCVLLSLSRPLFFSLFARFWFPFWLFFGAKIAKSGSKKSFEKYACKKVLQERKGSRRKPPCPPLKGQSQDWQQGQGIRDTPLVPGGTWRIWK